MKIFSYKKIYILKDESINYRLKQGRIIDGYSCRQIAENTYLFKAQRRSLLIYNSFLPEIFITLNQDKSNLMVEYKLNKGAKITFIISSIIAFFMELFAILFCVNTGEFQVIVFLFPLIIFIQFSILSLGFWLTCKIIEHRGEKTGDGSMSSDEK